MERSESIVNTNVLTYDLLKGPQIQISAEMRTVLRVPHIQGQSPHLPPTRVVAPCGPVYQHSVVLSTSTVWSRLLAQCGPVY